MGLVAETWRGLRVLCGDVRGGVESPNVYAETRRKALVIGGLRAVGAALPPPNAPQNYAFSPRARSQGAPTRLSASSKKPRRPPASTPSHCLAAREVYVRGDVATHNINALTGPHP